MATDYLLPCTCGRTHRVSSRQAGDKLACSCGISLDVPTMRGLKDLEPASPAALSRKRQWGAAQGLMFLGLVLVGAGVTAGLWYSLVVMPAPSEVEVSPAVADKMGLLESLAYWGMIQKGIDSMGPPDMLRVRGVDIQRNYATNCLHLAWMTTFLGGAVSAAGIIVRRLQSSR